MTAIQLEVQSAHGFVPLLVVLLMLVIFWAGIKVGKARELYGVNYPQVMPQSILLNQRPRRTEVLFVKMYAEQSNRYAKAFNCLTKVHARSLLAAANRSTKANSLLEDRFSFGTAKIDETYGESDTSIQLRSDAS
ncbi:hypothetical protein ON010_g16808 [Phytophthora cinnamomi]|nr:hypothetical protein ON010_g16808 [Phytophthora cinnamomi]